MQPRVADLLCKLEPTEATFEAIRAGGDEVIPVGLFRAILDPNTSEEWASSAVPVDPLGSPPETMEHIQAVWRLFAQRGRTAVIEFNEPMWPQLRSILRDCGFVLYDREPLMICVPDDFRPAKASAVAVRYLQPDDPDAQLAAYQKMFVEILAGEPWRETPQRLARLRAEIVQVNGRGHVLATLHGRPVGTGFITSAGGVSEITRIATVPEARRQGVGSAVTTFMVEDSFSRSDTIVWLTAEDAPAQALYEKVGFQVVGDRVYFRAPV